MGKLTEFIIILNTQRVVFYPGEQISGQVVVNLLEPMDMRGIQLEFEGEHLFIYGLIQKILNAKLLNSNILHTHTCVCVSGGYMMSISKVLCDVIFEWALYIFWPKIVSKHKTTLSSIIYFKHVRQML